MDAYFLIWAVILIGGTLILYAIAKSILKAAATFFFILLLFIAITVTLTYSDIETMKSELKSGNMLLVLKESSTVLFAMEVSKDGENSKKQQPQETEEAIEDLLNAKELETLQKKEGYSKIILIDKKAYEALDEQIETENGEKIKTELFAMVENDAGTVSFEERAEAFDFLNTALEEEGKIYLLSQYKEGNIEVIPKTMVFRILSFVPKSWVEKWVDEKWLDEE